MKEYKAEFLWPHDEESVEAMGYEFANAKTEKYRKECWDELLRRVKNCSIPDVVEPTGKLVCDTCKSGLINYPEIGRRTCRCGALGYNVTD